MFGCGKYGLKLRCCEWQVWVIMSSTNCFLFCSWWVLCFRNSAWEHLIISLHASLGEQTLRCFPSSPISLPSDQRPSLCSSHGLSQVLPCHPLAYAIVLQAHWGHPVGAPSYCWFTGIGCFCHSVWLRPLGDPLRIYISPGYLHNAQEEGERDRASRESPLQ